MEALFTFVIPMVFLSFFGIFVIQGMRRGFLALFKDWGLSSRWTREEVMAYYPHWSQERKETFWKDYDDYQTWMADKDRKQPLRTLWKMLRGTLMDEYGQARRA
jgi:hypothetical protein